MRRSDLGLMPAARPRKDRVASPRKCGGLLTALAAVTMLAAAAGIAAPRQINAETSTLTVRVSKSGVLSAFGHDHEITAPIAEGTVDAESRQVELHVKAASLRVADPKVSEKDRDTIQKTMLGPEVLDVEHNAEISFRSSGAEAAGAGAWKVQGDLTLHGQTHPVTVEVHEANGHYVGTSRFLQSAFGMKPVKVAGGSVQVKDEIRIEFDIQLAR